MVGRLRNTLSVLAERSRHHRGFLVVLVVAAVLWAIVFQTACIDFVAEGSRPFRASWLGNGQISLFGYTLPYNLEGWADHDYFYISWADQFLSGHLPYADRFEVQEINDWVYYQPYFLPPLFLYVCVLGRVLPIQPFGIGLVLTLFGYLTTFPIYGIAVQLSERNAIGIASSATYLFNPVILYYTVFQWLNPAPFVFFVMLSFYFLIKGSRTAGLLSMVTAAFFKQIALFFALPLIASILVPSKKHNGDSSNFTIKQPDFSSFSRATKISLCYAILLSIPYILNPLSYLGFIFGHIGSVHLSDYSTLPGPNRPITVAVLFILFGAPEGLVQIIDFLQSSSLLLILGVVPVFWSMLRSGELGADNQDYWKHILFLSLLMIFWVHIFSPRGIFKYYTVALIPFVCLLPSNRALSRKSERTLSPFCIINPILFSVLILIPDRNLYIAFLLFALLLYAIFGYRDKWVSLVSGIYYKRNRMKSSIVSTNATLQVPYSSSQFS
ncbi:MAG: hypothetical protein P1Q69_18910 [Candidatus Thorarchaeota archaeon]|nr:hypothetical protein [Candidatus Thorarchaeota archaeon]